MRTEHIYGVALIRILLNHLIIFGEMRATRASQYTAVVHNVILVLRELLLPLLQTIFLFAFELKIFNLVLHEPGKTQLRPVSLLLAAWTLDVLSEVIVHYVERVWLPVVGLAYVSIDLVYANFTEYFRTDIAHFGWQPHDPEADCANRVLDELFLRLVFYYNHVLVQGYFLEFAVEVVPIILPDPLL